MAVLIAEDEMRLYREWIDNNRALDGAVRQMRVSIEAGMSEQRDGTRATSQPTRQRAQRA